MTHTATKWTIGRSHENDVVVDAKGVETSHCELVYQDGIWWTVPLDGDVGIRGPEQDSLRWSRERMKVSENDSLWLTKDTKLPWPSEIGARAALTVGRASDCDIVLEHSLVSGRHALMIVGPNATWVLRDNDSRNGLFVDADVSRRVAAVMLQPGRQIYLGSQRFEASELVAKAKLARPVPAMKPVIPNLGEMKPTLVDIKPTTRPRYSHAVTTVVSTLVPSVFAVAFWWFFMRSDVAPVENPDSSAKAASVIEPSLPSGIMPVEASMLSGESVPVAETVENVDPGQSIYWILVRHVDTGNFFRLGSGVAISPDAVLTTASILGSLMEMSKNGYSQPTLVQVVSGKQFAVTSTQQFPEFLKRSQTATAIVADYERLVVDIGDNAEKVKQLKDELHKKAELVNVAMAATAAVDVGWLGTSGLPASLTVDESFNYRPTQGVSCLAAGFDAQDPFVDTSSTAQPTPLEMRVKSIAGELGGFSGIATLQASVGDLNVFGSPIVHHDMIVGMIVFQDSETGTLEAVTASVLVEIFGSINK